MSLHTDWKAKYEEIYDFAVESNQIIGEAVESARYWRSVYRVMLTVIAAGFHAIHEPGMSLVEIFVDRITEGTLDVDDLTREDVWQTAAEHEFETDLTPIFS